MQNSKESPGRSTNRQQQSKSIFSCKFYQTDPKLKRQGFKKSSNFAQELAKATSKTPQILYINEHVLENKVSEFCSGDLQDRCTQTSKTIIQLAKIESGEMSPDSLTRSPRENDDIYSCDKYSCIVDEFDQDCDREYPQEKRQNNTHFTNLNINRYFDSCVLHNSVVEEREQYVCSTSLTKTFLEKTRKNIPEGPSDWNGAAKTKNSKYPNTYRSKSFNDGNYCHPNFINEQITTEIRTRINQSQQKSNKMPLILPDNSYTIQRCSTVPFRPHNSFMSPTTASQNKSQMPQIQSLNHLIPPMRRGRSTSPRIIKITKSAAVPKKIPYIDQSKTNLTSSTSIVNLERSPNHPALQQNIFEEDLLRIHQLTPRVACLKSKNLYEEELDGGSLNYKSSYESIITNNETNLSLDETICLSINKLCNSDWPIALRGLAEIVELCRIIDSDDMSAQMMCIYQRLIELLKSPRSYVCRTACQAAGHLFEYMKDTRKPGFDDIVNILLFKTADANKFIRHDANLSLDCMVTHIPTFHAIRAICAKGPFHKNPLVRTATVRLLVCSVVIAGPETILNPNNSEYTRKRVIINMGKFLEDKNLETRKLAERLYKVLYKESKFESYMKKYLDRDQISKIKKILKFIHKKS